MSREKESLVREAADFHLSGMDRAVWIEDWDCTPQVCRTPSSCATCSHCFLFPLVCLASATVRKLLFLKMSYLKEQPGRESQGNVSHPCWMQRKWEPQERAFQETGDENTAWNVSLDSAWESPHVPLMCWFEVAVSHETRQHNVGRKAMDRALHDRLAPLSFILQYLVPWDLCSQILAWRL